MLKEHELSWTEYVLEDRWQGSEMEPALLFLNITWHLSDLVNHVTFYFKDKDEKLVGAHHSYQRLKEFEDFLLIQKIFVRPCES